MVEGFNYFFNLHYPGLLHFALGMLQVQEEAEEVVDDCFIRIWKRHSEYTSPGSLKAVLYLSVRNGCIDILRRRKLQARRLQGLNGMDTEVPPVHQLMIRTETLSEVYRALDSLPPQCRQVFSLFYLEERSMAEIADMLELSINTVRNHKVRALVLLRGKLGKKADD